MKAVVCQDAELRVAELPEPEPGRGCDRKHKAGTRVVAQPLQLEYPGLPREAP